MNYRVSNVEGDLTSDALLRYIGKWTAGLVRAFGQNLMNIKLPDAVLF